MVRMMKQTSAIRITGYTGLILTLSYLFWFLQTVDISLIYYWQQTVPIPFSESLNYPGALSDLLGERWLELLALPFMGSVSVALLVVFVFISLYIIFRRIKVNPFYFTLLLAALIPFILLFAYYRLPAGLIMSLNAGFLLAAIHKIYSPRNLLARSVYIFISGIIVYLVAGTVGLLVLLQVIIIQVVLSKKYLELISVLPMLIIPVLYLPFNLSFTVKYAYLGSFLISKYYEIPLILYFSLFTPLLLLLVFKGLNYILSPFALKRTFLLSGTGIIVVIIVFIFSSMTSINKQDRIYFKVLQASSKKDWEEVIRLTSEQLYINGLIQVEINRALYQTGQLLDKLFLYPQQFGEKGIFLDDYTSSFGAIHMSEFYYDLGFANEARHWATEAQVSFMRHPIVLKHLVMTYIAIGINEAALKYLHVLSGSRLYEEWCNDVHEMIENNTACDDLAIQSFIVNNPETDFFAQTKNPTQKLRTFYSSNLNNNMAFEFLVASYLLQHKVGNVMNQLPGFRRFGYEKLPRVVEEAMLIYLARTRADNPPLAGYSISQSTIEEFQDFSRLVASTEDRAERKNKAAKYRNTYWYYVFFTSPYASK